MSTFIDTNPIPKSSSYDTFITDNNNNDNNINYNSLKSIQKTSSLNNISNLPNTLKSTQKVTFAEGTKEAETSWVSVTISSHKHIKESKYVIYSLEVLLY
jgi:hypothetical protein